MPARVASFKAMVGSPRINGIANEFLAYLFNPVGSGVLVGVRRLSVQDDYTTNTGTIRTLMVSTITSAPTGGTVHTPVPFDTTGGHVSAVEFRSAASADGVATAITGVATAKAWMQYPMRLTDLTSTGQLIIDDMSMIPDLVDDDPFVLAEGEGLLVSANAAPSSAQHFIVNVVWEEFLYAAGGQTWLQAIDADAPTSMWRFHTEATLVDRVDGNDGTYSGNPVNVGGAIVGDTNQATAFDGVGDTAIVPDAANLRPANLTIEGWAWIDAAAAQFDPIVMQTTSGSWNDGYGIHVETGPRLRFWINNYTIQSAAASNHIDSPVLSTGAWHHVFATFDGAQMRLVVDRVEVSGSPVALTAAIAHSTSGLRFASDPGSIFLNGRLDDWVLFPTALSVARGQAHYDAALGLGGGGAALTWTIADTVSVADTQQRDFGYGRTIGDTVGVADVNQPDWSLFRTLADTIGVADAIVLAQGLARTLADTAGVSDSVLAGLLRLVSIADSVPGGDSLTVESGKEVSIADSAGVSDAQAAVTALFRAISDTASVADAQSVAVGWARIFGDSLSVADVRTAVVGYLRTIADTAGVADAASTAGQYIRVIADSAGVADAANPIVSSGNFLTQSVGDTLSVSDGVSLQAQYLRGLADAANVADSRVLEAGYARLVADSVSVADETAEETSLGLSVVDAVPVSDVVASMVTYSRFVADELDVADDLSWESALALLLADALVVEDTLVVEATEGHPYRLIRIGIGDSALSEVLTGADRALGIGNSADAALMTVKLWNSGLVTVEMGDTSPKVAEAGSTKTGADL